MKSKSLFIVFGSQLFQPKFFENHKDKKIYLAETVDLCTYYKFHKHKIAFFLSNMRHFAEELTQAGFDVHYRKLDHTKNKTSYIELLEQYLQLHKIEHLFFHEIEDKFMEKEIFSLAKKLGLQITVCRNLQFLVTRDKFKDYLGKYKKPFLKNFYELQRKEFKILMTEDLKPVGGKYSFDEDNRLRWPEKEPAPRMPQTHFDEIDLEVLALVEDLFPDHPGSTSTFWLPTTRKAAQAWLKDFCAHRLERFGPYEDALSKEEDFLFHSALAPMMNIGLLTAADVVKYALITAEKTEIPLNSLEGFLRQVLGWREFVRGIYQNFSDKQETTNFFNHQHLLNENWYTGQTGCPPLDDAIQKVVRLSWNHHIERLMVISNIMNLSQIHPHEAHRWFMEMYSDSSDWVMGPNVYGMGLFSDGGIFATKPYICGSNYLLKMSHYSKGDWCEEIDGLYWQFIARNSSFFKSNPRLGMMVRTYEKMPGEKKGRLAQAADQFVKRNTILPRR